MNKTKTLAALFCPLLLFIGSCRYDQLDPGPTAVQDSCDQHMPDVVSFSRHVLPILAANCATSGCHSGSTPESNLNLEAAVAYDNLMKPGSGYVNTAKPTQSIVYRGLISTSSPMPPLGNLPPCEIRLILKWIEQQAKNN